MQKRQFLLTLFSSILFPLALPNDLFPYGNPLLGLFALTPFFIALYRAPSYKAASILGVLFGGISTFISSYWLMFFGDYSFWTIGGTVLGYIMYNSVFAPFLMHFSKISGRYRPIVISAAWTGYEFLKSIGYLAYPWGLSAYPFAEIHPLVQIADVTGIWGLCFLAVLFNALLAEIFIGYDKSRKNFLKIISFENNRSWFRSGFNRTSPFIHFFIILLFAVLSYGYIRLAIPIPIKKHVNMVLVQQNMDPWINNNEIRSLKKGINLSRKGLRNASDSIDLVVWSETSLNRPLSRYRNFYTSMPSDDPLFPFIKNHTSYFLFGVPLLLEREYLAFGNGVALVSPETEVIDTYAKQHPVPFAENFPFWEYEPIRNFVRKFVGLYGVWDMGSENTVFTIPISDPSAETVRFSTPVCFEDAFGELCSRFYKNGAEILINLTNDSWSKTVSSQTQHYIAAKFRTIENRRVMVRSTNSGVTAVIDPWGKKHSDLPMFSAESLIAKVPVYREKGYTIYTMLGNYFPKALLAALFLLLLISAGKIYFKNSNFK